jgi:hypothetical protein
MKGGESFRRRDGIWLPEHVRLLVERALIDRTDASVQEAHLEIAALVRKAHPALPMSERELLVAIARLAQQP